jgi:nicotinate (nicotinamide) nucleotide adenylyltransferase
MSRTRIGVLGGTFDPIHNGHLTAARSVREQLDLDGVLVAPANDPWQKKTVATPQQRLTMARLAVAGMSGIDVSDVDIARGGQTFTIDTLADLRKLHPLTLFSLFIVYRYAPTHTHTYITYIIHIHSLHSYIYIYIHTYIHTYIHRLYKTSSHL